MKLVLATPLYPPDIAEPAPYVQELARRLADQHDVTIVTYGHFVEPIVGVRILAVHKRSRAPIRLVRYFFTLLGIVRNSDAIYAENGPSVELPCVLVSLLSRKPLFFHLGDRPAHERAAQKSFLGFLERVTRAHARHVFEELPHPRPEIIPFRPRPLDEERSYEASWEKHLNRIVSKLTHA